ncbi:MAG: ctpD, partial [Streptosporangiaceae bacterium]|nr:ctpD [Streptosporangiaceae bacterium]
DLFGHLPLPLGVLGHEGSTVVVGLNGLRMLSGRAWRPSGPAGVRGRAAEPAVADIAAR